MFRDDWQESEERFCKLWKRERADRSCVSMTLLKKPENPVAFPYYEPDDYFRRMITDEEFMYHTVMQTVDKFYFAGDAFPCVNLYLGTSGHCGYTKNYKYGIASHTNTLWFDPVMDNITDFSIEFDPQSELFQITKRILAYMKDKGGRDFFVANTDNCSSLDALANLRGSAELLLDMLEEPEAVHVHMKRLQSILHKTEDEFHEEIAAINGGATCTSWMGLWHPGRHHQLQCDISVMISPDMFEEFALPELKENAAKFENTVYHLDGEEQIRHLDMILSVDNIDIIQWTAVAGQPPTSHFLETLKKIQKAGKGLLLMPNASEMPFLLENLDPAGVMYQINGGIGTPEQADEMVELVTRKTVL